MGSSILCLLLSFAITFFAIPSIIEVARQKGLFDEPTERKQHSHGIPALGGLAIFGGTLLGTLFFLPQIDAEAQFIFAALIILFFMGVKDDILILAASKKLVGQVVVASIIIYFCDIRILNFYGFLGLSVLSPAVSFMLTLFTMVVIINSFNLIDGIDALAASLGIFTSAVFSWYFLANGEPLYAVLALSLTGSLIAFLMYNYPPAKIFMGDTGSTLIGVLNAVFVIKFITQAAEASSPVPVDAAPAIGFAILIVPLFDTLRIFGLRILQKRSPFSSDRSHIHHYLLDLGFSHRAITAVLLAVNVLFVMMAWLLRGLGTTLVISILLASATSIITAVYYTRFRLRRLVALRQPLKKPKSPVVRLVQMEAEAVD